MIDQQQKTRVRVLLDTATTRQLNTWQGHGVAVVDASSSAAAVTVARANDTTGQQLRLGMGWTGDPFDALFVTWAAQPGEWVDVEYWGGDASPGPYSPLRFPGLSTVPLARSAAILARTTDATGAAWAAFGSITCNALDLVNTTGTAIEYCRNGAGNSIAIPDGSARLIVGISNANQVSIRRVDQSTSQVTLAAEALTA